MAQATSGGGCGGGHTGRQPTREILTRARRTLHYCVCTTKLKAVTLCGIRIRTVALQVEDEAFSPLLAFYARSESYKPKMEESESTLYATKTRKELSLPL